MGFPFLAAATVLGVGASLFGGSQAAGAASDASAVNLQIAQENADLQRELFNQELQFVEEQNALQRALADQVLQIQLQGFTGPSGETVRFQEGEGFVTTLDPTTQAIVDASKRNQLIQSTVEAERGRGEQAAASVRRGEISNLSNALINQLQQPGISPERIEGLLQTGRSAAANRAFDDAVGSVATQGLRTGSDPTELLRALTSQRAETLSGLTGNIELEAIKEAAGINTARSTNLLNQLGLTETLAGGTGQTVFQGGALGDALTAQAATGGSRVAQAGNLAAQGQQGFPNIAGQGVNFRQAVDPNAGKFATGIGNAISGLSTNPLIQALFAQGPTGILSDLYHQQVFLLIQVD